MFREMTQGLGALALGATVMAAPALAEDVTITGEDAFIASMKTTCGTTEAATPRYGYFEGKTYSRVPGEKDQVMFNVLGINTRHCLKVDDPVRGPGFRSISREIMVYMDPETNEVIDAWENPYTGEMIEVMHVANDPVNMRAIRYLRDEDGEMSAEVKLRRYGNLVTRAVEVPLFYDNPLGGPYQKYVGGKYHAMEIFNGFYDADELLDADVTRLTRSHVAWTRVAQWLPWMAMGDQPGLMVFNAIGSSTFDYQEVPQRLRDIIDARFPEYKTPPPLDDDRENETSWTVFKDKLEAAE